VTHSIVESVDDIVTATAKVTMLWANLRSKDPSTKVGACIYDNRTGGLFMGYNGFPAGIHDHRHTWMNREDNTNGEDLLTKYDLVVHAEVNAVSKALRAGVDLTDSFMITTTIPCKQCMKDVVAMHRIPIVYYLNDSYYSRTARDVFVCDEITKLCGVSMIKLEI